MTLFAETAFGEGLLILVIMGIIGLVVLVEKGCDALERYFKGDKK